MRWLAVLCLAASAFAGGDVADLPERVAAPDGKLTLWADFANASSGRVPLYLVNRTKKKVQVPTQDGDLLLKLEAQAPDGDWERAQGHRYSDCGNSYYPIVVEPGRYVLLQGLFPSKGEKRKVRYRHYGWRGPKIVSNAGEGRVSPKAVARLRGDRMTVEHGTVDDILKIATGEVAAVDDWMRTRPYAVRQLGHTKTQRISAVLTKLLADKDPEVRATAADVLDAYGDLAKPAHAALVELLGDPAVKVRRAAADTVGRLGIQAAFAGLVDALADDDHMVRYHATTSLGRLGNRAAIPKLKDAEQDPEKRVRDGAVWALTQLRDPR